MHTDEGMILKYINLSLDTLAVTKTYAKFLKLKIRFS